VKGYLVNNALIRIFIGFDPRETIGFHVLSQSIHSRCSQPVSITPIALSQLGSLMSRERNSLQSTDFSFSRFLTPYLCNYDGWAIFMDCDMLVLEDIKHLWDLKNDKFAVQVVKHDHKPTEKKKFLDQTQSQYEKKNWSSVILFNCKKCKNLTPNYVNTASGLDLHRFRWLDNEDLIGDIPHKWNHLANYDEKVPSSQIANIHYTSGGPYFDDYINTDYADEWKEEQKKMLRCDQLTKKR